MNGPHGVPARACPLMVIGLFVALPSTVTRPAPAATATALDPPRTIFELTIAPDAISETAATPRPLNSQRLSPNWMALDVTETAGALPRAATGAGPETPREVCE